MRQRLKTLLALVASIYNTALMLSAFYLTGVIMGFTLLWLLDELPTEPIEPMNPFLPPISSPLSPTTATAPPPR